MHEAETCFRQLADSLPQLVWMVGADERLSYGNRIWRSRTAIGEGDRFAHDFVAALHPEDRQSWQDTWHGALGAGREYEISSRVRFASDVDYVLQLERGYPIRDGAGRIVEWMMLGTAPDDDERLITQLRRSLQREHQLLATVAHELRNPLAPIANALELVERRKDDPMLVANARAVIARQVEQLRRLIDDLLDLARLEHAHMELRRNLVDLSDVVNAALEAAQPLVASRRHEITVARCTQPAVVVGDQGRLIQVITNLLINAAKYTDSPGQIRLEIERDAPWLLVKVRDTGIGIPREMLPNIFDVYVRGPADRDANRGGLGLGLALAREFVAVHGGTLSAHSEGPGRGSEFIVRLPAADRADRQTSIPCTTAGG